MGGEMLSYNEGEDKFFQHTWRGLYESVGLAMVLPTCGLSEVGTMRVVDGSNLLDKSSSCQLGEYQQPCRECQKCFRKDLIMILLRKMKWEEFIGYLDGYLSSPKVINYVLLAPVPLALQYVYM